MAAAQEFPRVPDCICARGAGISDDGYGTAKAEGVGEVKGLALCLVMNDAGGLFVVRRLRIDNLTIEILTEAHTGACSAQHDRQVLARPPSRLLPCFRRREQKHSGAAVE